MFEGLKSDVISGLIHTDLCWIDFICIVFFICIIIYSIVMHSIKQAVFVSACCL